MNILNIKLVYFNSIKYLKKSDSKWLNGVINLNLLNHYSNKFSSSYLTSNYNLIKFYSIDCSNNCFKFNNKFLLFNSFYKRPLSNQKVIHKFNQFNNNKKSKKLNKKSIYSTIRKSINQSDQLIESTKMKDLNDKLYTYEEAIETLNSLQSNLTAIQKRLSEDPTTREQSLKAKVNRARLQLYHLGINQDDLKSMNIIHISGTKGKGSTCAFIENILRKKGFRTGLFTSPHLISVRERIQLDGKLIDRKLFAQNFFKCYNQLQTFNSPYESNDDLSIESNRIPFYFNFLTLMALYTFKQQKCNAVILEVGIGGEYDCTNIVEKPICTGVTSLGIDHVKLLGNSLKEIAWHKAGIFKKNIPAFIADNQKIEALSVLLERSKERNCPLRICPPIDNYKLEDNRQLKLGLAGDVQKLNASLALQISDYFINKLTNNSIIDLNINANDQLYANTFKLTNNYLDALEECKWRGRFEIIELKNKSKFYLDGAHTIDSLNYCVDWFKNELKNENKNKLFKILIFNCTGYRDFYQLLKPILDKEKFDLICFTTNLKTIDDLNNSKSDQFNANGLPINRDEYKEKILNDLHYTGNVKHFDCLENCLKGVKIKNDENLLNNLNTKVLVTGSIYLVGGVISLLNERYC